MKRLQTTKYKLLVSINGVYLIVVDSPLSSITSKEQIHSGLYYGYNDSNGKVGIMRVNDFGFTWVADDGGTAVDVTSVSSEIIG